eukprot:m.88605 g.88605  ORF g.88605 m.88605 type:complete len:69 (-) comp12866_c0_seq3:4217-4423(-)
MTLSECVPMPIAHASPIQNSTAQHTYTHIHRHTHTTSDQNFMPLKTRCVHLHVHELNGSSTRHGHWAR